MVITAWIIGIAIFVFSLFSIWATFFVILLTIGGLFALSIYTGFDPIVYLGEENFNMIGGALFGPWILVLMLNILGNFFGFVEDVGKAVKNLADDERKEY